MPKQIYEIVYEYLHYITPMLSLNWYELYNSTGLCLTYMHDSMLNHHDDVTMGAEKSGER